MTGDRAAEGPVNVHATCVAIDGRGVLIIGEPGSGKSDLALRLIDRGGVLVSDDATTVLRQGATLVASPPPTIAGKIEVRGVGIIDMPWRRDVTVALVVDVSASPERMPDAELRHDVLGVAVPKIALVAHDASTPVKVELALRRATGEA